MSFGITPAAARQADTDCYYYYYSSCQKGNSCEFRHEPSAMGKEVVCEHWLKGNCVKTICSFRHMKITKKREGIPCFHENQAGGCTKPHCPFLHGVKAKSRFETPCIFESRPGGCTNPQCQFLHTSKQKYNPTINEKRGKRLQSQGNSAPEQLRNIGLNAVNPQKIGRGLHKAALLSKKNMFVDNTLKTKGNLNCLPRQHAAHRNLSASDVELLSPADLVVYLSKNRNFSATTRLLSMLLKCKEMIVRQTVHACQDTFIVKKDSILLRPKVKICDEFVEDGCDEGQNCSDLHLCPSYIISICNNTNCILGHVLKTDHNKRIYQHFSIEGLSTFNMQNLFRTLGPSFWAMEDNVKICEDYNEGNCLDDDCKLLHLCLSFLANRCPESIECKLRHSVPNVKGKMTALLNSHGLLLDKDVMERIARGPVVKEQIKYLLLSDLLDNSASSTSIKPNNLAASECNPILRSMPTPVNINITTWSHHYLGETTQSEICFESVEGLCPLEDSGCPKLHSAQHFHWQVKESGQKWVNLRAEHLTTLEKAYCDPEVLEVELPPLDPAALDSSLKGLLTMMQGRKKWKANFDSMQLSLPGNKPLEIRRLSTTKITGGITPEPCVYLWYFLDKNNKWIEYGNTDSTGDSTLQCQITSGDLEKYYIRTKNVPMTINNLKFTYSLDFLNMMQTNIATHAQRKMKRRPKPHLIVENKSDQGTDCPEHWESMHPQERAKRVLLSPNSEEYQKVANLYTSKGGSGAISKIERVQNVFLWRTFQTKVQELTLIYNSKDAVNIQQLFHGTRVDVVEIICKENLDWRLHGSNCGQAYGRGTYFSPYSSTAYGYTRPDPVGRRCMFVAQVAVGTLAKGGSTMARPPQNPLTNSPYDSTADKVLNPNIVVKYDKQEYYPEYILTLT